MPGRCFGLVLVSLVSFGAAGGAESGTYVIEAPDILRIVAYALPAKAELVDGEHCVRPDGTVSLGIYGNLAVDGLTVDQAKEAITKQLTSQARPDGGLRVRVEVEASNSKVCYVIARGKEGDQVYRLPFDGRATVASAVLEFEGLAAAATEGGVWISRPTGKEVKILKVDWQAITGAGHLASNHRLEAGDRVFVGVSPRE